MLCCVLIVFGNVLLKAQSEIIASKDPKAAEALTASIKALGGEKNIDAIQSLILTGTTTFAQTKVVEEVEVRIFLPDNVIWISKRPMYIRYNGVSNGVSRNAGFAGKERMGVPTSTAQDELKRLAILLIGTALREGPVAPLTLSSVAGASDKYNITNATGDLGVVEFDPKDKFPSFIGFKDVVADYLSEPTTVPGTNIMRTTLGGPETKNVDAGMRFKDRVAVDGIMFPMTIVFESGGEVDREVRFEKIQINPKLTVADFEIPKR